MATQAITVIEGSTTPVIEWEGGEGYLDIYGIFADDIIQVEYSRDEGVSWAKFEDGQEIWRADHPRGFIFKLPACQIRARVVRGTPDLIMAVDAVT